MVQTLGGGSECSGRQSGGHNDTEGVCNIRHVAVDPSGGLISRGLSGHEESRGCNCRFWVMYVCSHYACGKLGISTYMYIVGFDLAPMVA